MTRNNDRLQDDGGTPTDEQPQDDHRAASEDPSHTHDRHDEAAADGEHADDEENYGPDHYGPAIRLVGRILRNARTPGGRRPNGKREKGTTSVTNGDELLTAFNLIGRALERAIPDSRRRLVEMRASALLAGVMRNYGSAQPGVTAPEPVRAGFTRVLRAIREGKPRSPSCASAA